VSSPPTIIGKTIAGRFRVTGFIGEGAMASVYRGTQDAEPHEVAIKIMHPHLVDDSSFVRRFQREAKAAAQIQHPNTVQIIAFGVDGDLPYIVMEMLGGKDLFETLVVERQLSEARAVRIGIQICDALSAAHDKGIIHRDLKPENIMILRDLSNAEHEIVKVLDFGIAKILDREPVSTSDPTSSAPQSALTKVGMVVGTPAYMSPEQCRGEPIDARSDIYACGILLYQLVTGRLPFAGDNAIDLALKHVRTPPPAPSIFVPTINRELESLILTALSKWPAQRQQSARQLKAELERILPSLTSSKAVQPDELVELESAATLPRTATLPLPLPDAPRRSIKESIDLDVLGTLRSELEDAPPPPSNPAAVAVVEAPPLPQPPPTPEAKPKKEEEPPPLLASQRKRVAPARGVQPFAATATEGEGRMWPVIVISVVIGALLGLSAFLMLAR